MVMGKLGDCDLTVAPYPVPWRVEVVDDDKHRGFEYVRSALGINRCHGVSADFT